MEANEKTTSRWKKYKTTDTKEVDPKVAETVAAIVEETKKTTKKASKGGVGVKLVKHPHATFPEYKTPGAAGADVCANIMYPKWLEPGKVELIDTGLTVAEIPEGYELQVRSRSGLALKGIFVLNAPGTIDADYRGPIGVILANFGKDKFEITRGMRMAQLVLAKVERANYEAVAASEVAQTERADGGFGSTGV